MYFFIRRNNSKKIPKFDCEYINTKKPHMKMKKLLLLLLIISPFTLYSQVYITPYVSSGYINHLGRKGINTELGIEAELFKRLDLSINYRYTKADRAIGNEVEISGITSNISYVLINRNNHRFMFGPGLTFGRYTRNSDYLGFEKEYKSLWFDFVKLRYDYTINEKIRVGTIVNLTGDDGDSSTYFGLLIGYKF
jgi:hypothetical protein